MGGLVAVVSKKGENVTRTLVDMMDALELSSEAFGIASATTIKTEISLEALRKSDVKAAVAAGCTFSRILASDKPELTQLVDGTMVFDGRIYTVHEKESDVGFAARMLSENPEKGAATFVRKTEGDFAFAMVRSETIVAGRDTMGVRPLYFSENNDVAALASERKALWRIGLNEAFSFPPGTVSVVGRCGFKFKVARRITYSEPKQVTLRAATQELQRLVEHSVTQRTASLDEVAVAFSGGLDSSIIACLAKRTGVNVILVHASMENEPEMECAKQAAEALKLPLYSSLHSEHDVTMTLPKVIRIIEEPHPIKISIGIPFYWAAEKTARMDCPVMVAGQGADEFFGGYRRYLDEYVRGNKQGTLNAIFTDVIGMHEANLERDFKICNYSGVELRLPFATYAMARFALDLPLELKMERKDNSLRKLVLRRVAKNLGLPHFIVNKPKGAIQYTTGVSKVIRKISRQGGVSVTEYCQKMFMLAFRDFQELTRSSLQDSQRR